MIMSFNGDDDGDDDDDDDDGEIDSSGYDVVDA